MKTLYPEFMQYISPYGDAFNFDGLYKFISSDEGFGIPDIEYITQRGPFQHGETVIDYRLSPRVVQVMYNENAKTRSEYWNRRLDLTDFFRPNRHASGQLSPGVLRKRISNGKIFDLEVFLDNGFKFAQSSSSGGGDTKTIGELLRFRAPDPTFYDPVHKTFAFVWASSNNLVFPIVFPIRFGSLVLSGTGVLNYEGTWPAYPIITVVGPLDGFRIENASTGEFIKLNYNIGTAETVVISLDFGNKTIVSNIKGNILGVVEGNMNTFHLEGHPTALNGDNIINVAGTFPGVTTLISLCWNARFIGV